MFLSGLIILSLLTVSLLSILSFRYKSLLFWIPFLNLFVPAQYIQRYFFDVPNAIIWIGYLIPPFFAVLSIISYRGVRKQIFKPKLVLGLLIVYELITIISMTINGSGLLPLFISERGVIQIISWIIIIENFLPSKSFQYLLRIVLLAGLAVASIGIFQRIVFVSLLQLGSGDMVTGGFHGDSAYLFFLLFVFSLSLVLYLYNVRLLPIPNLLILSWLIAGIALGNNKAAFGFVALVILVLLVRFEFRVVVKRFVRLSALALFLFIGGWTADFLLAANNRVEQGEFKYYDSEVVIDYFFGGNKIDSEFAKSGELKRGAAVEFAVASLSRSTQVMVFGHGPNSASESKLVSARGKLNEMYQGLKLNRTDLSALLAEKGFLGSAVYLLFLISLGIPFFKVTSVSILKSVVVVVVLAYMAYESMMVAMIYPFILAILYTLRDDRLVIASRDTVFTEIQEFDSESDSQIIQEHE